jgi:hypothetical protein
MRGRPRGEGINGFALVAHRKVDVREFGVARKPHLAEDRAGRYRLSGTHSDAAPFQVTILGLPAIRVTDAHRVAGVLASQCGPSTLAHRQVWLTVASRNDSSGCGGNHIDPGIHRDQIGHPKIGAGMPVVRQRAAGVVTPAGASVVIDIVLDRTVSTGRTLER